ncbi:MAG: hypothetical protein IKC23_11550 [Fibrobacter sp.]|nr:hypothetical protein [Fibrobacter sp.]
MLRAFLRGLLEFRHGLVDGVHVLVHQHHAAVALDLGPAVETGEGFCQGVLQAAASFFIIPLRGGRYRLPERLLVTSVI